MFSNSIVFEPMPDGSGPGLILQTLLKRPGQIIYELFRGRAAGLLTWLLVLGVCGISLYGILVGAQSGGAQMMIAASKLGLAAIFSMLIGLPSL